MTALVVNLGLPKTGTTSLAIAARTLGYRPSKSIDYLEQLDHPEVNFFCELGPEIDLRELKEKYPDTKYIYTHRDLNSWLDSAERYLAKRKAEQGGKLGKISQRRNPIAYGRLDFERGAWEARWHKHGQEVKTLFTNYNMDNFLPLNICDGEGWEKLCPFLDKPIPIDVKFPHLNRSR